MGLPKVIHLLEAGPSLEPELALDRKVADAWEGPKQGYRAVSDPSIDWEGLARARAHPMQVAILQLLSMDDGRALSPNEMAFELQAALSTCSYHATELAKIRMLELVDTQPRRGAVEHYYRSVS
jgi:hypothetical protein